MSNPQRTAERPLNWGLFVSPPLVYIGPVAVKKIPVPFCDWCGLPFLPKFLLKGGTRNPIFDHPEKSRRCGKCKRTGWNAGRIDRRRKAANLQPLALSEEVVADLEKAPLATLVDTAPRARRCRHGLFNCKKCQPAEAA